MTILWDFIRRTFYLSVFIVPIPIGAYTIHNGSSAMAALFSYLVLSILIPYFYLKSKKSGFGPKKNIRIKPVLYWVGYAIVQVLTYLVFYKIELSLLWQLPTIGRDLVFMLVMYAQVLMSMLVAFMVNSILK